jgi:ArsR family transcriptional regulator
LVALRGVDFQYYFHNTGNVELKSVLSALAGLAQETRLSIFRLLVEQGPEGFAAGEIADRLGLANATLSFHLKEMARADLIKARQIGRFIYYSAHYTTMNELIAYLTENCCRGVSCDIACVPKSRSKRKAS